MANKYGLDKYLPAPTPEELAEEAKMMGTVPPAAPAPTPAAKQAPAPAAAAPQPAQAGKNKYGLDKYLPAATPEETAEEQRIFTPQHPSEQQVTQQPKTGTEPYNALDEWGNTITGGLSQKLNAAIQHMKAYLPEGSPAQQQLGPGKPYGQALDELNQNQASFNRDNPGQTAAARAAGIAPYAALGPVAGSLALANRGGIEALNRGKPFQEAGKAALVEGAGGLIGAGAGRVAAGVLRRVPEIAGGLGGAAAGGVAGGAIGAPTAGAVVGGHFGRLGGRAVGEGLVPQSANKLLSATGQTLGTEGADYANRGPQ